MYEHLPLSRLQSLLAIAQERLNGDYPTELKQIAAQVVEELQQEITAREMAIHWCLGG